MNHHQRCWGSSHSGRKILNLCLTNSKAYVVKNPIVSSTMSFCTYHAIRSFWNQIESNLITHNYTNFCWYSRIFLYAWKRGGREGDFPAPVRWSRLGDAPHSVSQKPWVGGRFLRTYSQKEYVFLLLYVVSYACYLNRNTFQQ